LVSVALPRLPKPALNIEAVLPLIVTLVSVAFPRLPIPPFSCAWFWLIVTLFSVICALSPLAMPPSRKPAAFFVIRTLFRFARPRFPKPPFENEPKLPLKTTLLSVAIARFPNPPLKTAVLPLNVTSLSVATPAFASPPPANTVLFPSKITLLKVTMQPRPTSTPPPAVRRLGVPSRLPFSIVTPVTVS
jgi:hypothetical protein